MNKRWEQITQCITKRDKSGQPLCSVAGLVAGSVFRAFPSKDQMQPEQRKQSSKILELSPLILQIIGCFSVEAMQGVGRRV